jgi:sterol desaturase/sphingolipid hydroxylase (fatty acid hydroxylase superfamily)
VWQPTLRSFWLDLLHSLVSAFAVAPAVRATLVVVLAGIISEMTRSFGVGLWPHSWPLVAELALAVIVADFGAYWAHHLVHSTRTGWRLHAVHHSLVRLNFVAAGRSHPFNAVLTFSCETGLLILLGVSAEVIALWSVVKACNGLLQHSNVDLRPGKLSALLATCDIHRWHHSLVPEESHANFGNTTTLWGRLFGTLFLPPGRRAATALGIDGARIPEHYLAHLATPFILGRYESDADAAESSGITGGAG